MLGFGQAPCLDCLMAETPALTVTAPRAAPSPSAKPIPWSKTREAKREYKRRAAAKKRGQVYRKDTTGAQPNRPGRPAAPSRAAQAKEVKEALALVIVLTDSLAASSSPVWADPNMRLKGAEVASLADALGDEVMSNERAAKFFLSVVAQNTHVKLAAVTMAIAIPRLAYKGVIPREIASAVTAPGQPAAQDFAPQSVDSSYTGPVPGPGEIVGSGLDDAALQVEGGGAHGDNGRHGQREIDLGGRTIDVAAVLPDSEVEA